MRVLVARFSLFTAQHVFVFPLRDGCNIMIELCEEPLGEVIEYCPDIAPEQDSTMAMKLALQSSPERDVVLGVQVEL